MCHRLQKGAIFVADAHESAKNGGFELFLQEIQDGKIPMPPQLFLMGDMFDLLVGEVGYTQKTYQKQIELINQLSSKTQIFYLEGNHDFNLKNIFPNVEIIAINEQPLRLNNGEILVSHGDNFGPLIYRIYAKLIRNSLLLHVLNIFDIFSFNAISKMIYKKLSQKINNTKMRTFNSLATARVLKYRNLQPKIIIEGHFHQG